MMPPSVLELVALGFTLVVERDQNPGVQERQLAQSLSERVEAEFHGLENLGIGPERNFRASLLGRAGYFEVCPGFAACVLLLENLPVAPDFQIELLRERVDDRHANPMQATRDFIAVVVELAAGVQDGHDDFGRRPPARVLVGRNPSPIVYDGD